ncbi:MAG: oligopeptide/dipeptide ABC transporter ATP-binding protein [Pseudomonadota bacterium]
MHQVSLTLAQGETLGIVGESGCGKSTLARMLVGLEAPSEGEIEIAGQPIGHYNATELGRHIQYVFQDPVASLNPRKTIRDILATPLKRLQGLSPDAINARVRELIDKVQLHPSYLDRYPHEFSGGQAQRIGIARALAAGAKTLVLDEPVSALDVSVQAQVLNLLNDLQPALGLSYLFISHDLAVVNAVSDKVAVLYFGSVVEHGSADTVFSAPKHPYTQLLAASVPDMHNPLRLPEQTTGELPNPLDPPSGCAFFSRCTQSTEKCRALAPLLSDHAKRRVACHHPL